jgi:hypothetical protein
VYGEGGVDQGYMAHVAFALQNPLAQFFQRRHKLGVLSAQFPDLPRSLAQ